MELLMVAMQSIDFASLGNILVENGVFAVLFGWLLYDTRKESKTREDRLMGHIEKQEVALDKVTTTIEKMDVRLSNIEDDVKDNKNNK